MLLNTLFIFFTVFFRINILKIEAKESSRTPKHLSSLPFQFRIPRTGFTCKNRAPGYYADIGANCEVYHMCTERGGKQSFLCPPRTRFNQKTLVCDFRRNVKCDDSSDFFHKNVVLHEESKKKAVLNEERSVASGGINLQKQPRLDHHFEILGLVEKKPQYIKAQGNGQIHFAPLFQERSRHNLARILDRSAVEQIKINNEIKEQKEDANKLEKKYGTNSPIIHVSPSKMSKFHSLQTHETSSKLRKDPETPSQRIQPPISPSVNPFQIVGHVMSSKDLTSFPDSPMVNISVKSDAQIGGNPTHLLGNARARNSEPHLVGKDSLGLPLQLKKVSQSRSPPLIWISPASLARSPMVSLRRLWDKKIPIRRTLTMAFPKLNRREIFGPLPSNNSI